VAPAMKTRGRRRSLWVTRSGRVLREEPTAAVDISSLLFGAAFALLGVGRLALADWDSRIGPVALQGAGMVLSGVGVMIIALLGPLPEHPTVGAVAVVAMAGVGLVLAVAGAALSRLGARGDCGITRTSSPGRRRQRRKALLSGLIMTTVSAILVWVGTAGGAAGVVLLIVGGGGVLFFGPLTVYVISELVRIRRTPRP
jgi:hypothetical protein